jgi:hypothetical protein
MENLKEGNNLRDPDEGERIILKWVEQTCCEEVSWNE